MNKNGYMGFDENNNNNSKGPQQLSFELPEGIKAYHSGDGKTDSGKPNVQLGGTLKWQGPSIEDADMGAAMMNFKRMAGEDVGRRMRQSVKRAGSPNNINEDNTLPGNNILNPSNKVHTTDPNKVSGIDLMGAYDEEGQNKFKGLSQRSKGFVESMYSNPQGRKAINQSKMQMPDITNQMEEEEEEEEEEEGVDRNI